MSITRKQEKMFRAYPTAVAVAATVFFTLAMTLQEQSVLFLYIAFGLCNLAFLWWDLRQWDNSDRVYTLILVIFGFFGTFIIAFAVFELKIISEKYKK